MSKQPILYELEYFINGAITCNTKKPSSYPHLVHCGLNLLRDLPASKDAVFEYFTMFFDYSVAGYTKHLEQKELNMFSSYDATINELQDALEVLLNNQQNAWAPYISTWSIKTLGLLSKKYKRTDHRDIASICNFWLGSSAMRCLLALTVSCFSELSVDDEEQFTDNLLSTYMQHSTCFDWVIARLGSCFPRKIISNVLQCGLRIFVKNDGSDVDSEIGILSYLSFIQGVQLRAVMKEMIELCLYSNTSNDQPTLSTIPYFFALASKSDVMLQEIVLVFLELSDNPEFIASLSKQVNYWPENFGVNDLIPTLTSLAHRVQKQATKVLLILAQISEQHSWCHNLLESILQDVFVTVKDNRACPLLLNVAEPDTQSILLTASTSNQVIVRQTALRLITLASIRSPNIMHHAISNLLIQPNSTENRSHIEALIRLISGRCFSNEKISSKIGITTALEQLLIDEIRMQDDQIKQNLNVLNNLLYILRLDESAGNCMEFRESLRKCSNILLEILRRYLTKSMEYVLKKPICPNGNMNSIKSSAYCSNDKSLKRKRETLKYSIIYKQHIHAVISLVDILKIGEDDLPQSINTNLNWIEMVVLHTFWSLRETDLNRRQIALAVSYSIFSRICSHQNYSKLVAILLLLESALFSYYNIFAKDSDAEIENRSNKKCCTDRFLIESNQKQNNTPNNIRSFLHAGVIGRGLKTQTEEVSTLPSDVRDALLNAITVCSKEHGAQTVFTNTAISLSSMVLPDNMYNGLNWPDEEFTRITIERDLHVYRTFRKSPVLWSILALISNHRSSIGSISVLLRSLCATLLHQWRAKSVLHNQTIGNNQELYGMTKNLLQIMAMGQLLVGPFAYLHLIIDYLEPFEIVVVLKECVWNNMKENISLLASIHGNSDISGLGRKETKIPKLQPSFVDPLRNIMQRKLSKIGMLYYYMFVCNELQE